MTPEQEARVGIDAKEWNTMKTLPIRLASGQDLRQAIEAAVRNQGCRAAFVLSGIGSLSTAGLRFAGADQPRRLTGDMEILSLSGSVANNGSHLHMALSTATGEVMGGHVAPGCIVRTTAEVLLALLPEWEFARESDAATGYDELVVRARAEHLDLSHTLPSERQSTIFSILESRILNFDATQTPRLPGGPQAGGLG